MARAFERRFRFGLGETGLASRCDANDHRRNAMHLNLIATIHAVHQTAINHPEVVARLLREAGAPHQFSMFHARTYFDLQEGTAGRRLEGLVAEAEYLREAVRAAGCPDAVLADLSDEHLGLTGREPVAPLSEDQVAKFRELTKDQPWMWIAFELLREIHLDPIKTFGLGADAFRSELKRLRTVKEEHYQLPRRVYPTPVDVAIDQAIEQLEKLRAETPAYGRRPTLRPRAGQLQDLQHFSNLCTDCGIRTDAFTCTFVRGAMAAYVEANPKRGEYELLEAVSRDLGWEGHYTQRLKAKFLLNEVVSLQTAKTPSPESTRERAPIDFSVPLPCNWKEILG
jgi:hypothetical protein